MEKRIGDRDRNDTARKENEIIRERRPSPERLVEYRQRYRKQHTGNGYAKEIEVEGRYRLARLFEQDDCEGPDDRRH